jgi:demethylmenaquinone methyltransferase/2-methoxy-6-polyprenyl-1,4-benzoquinol methylase
MTYRETLERTGQLVRGAIHAAIAELGIPPGAKGLDAGCGIGTDAIQLARVVGETGHVVGVDIDQALLDVAREAGARSSVASRLEFCRGDLRRLPCDTDSFDFVWCRDVMWGHLLDPFAGVGELARVVRPGGFVALAFWCSQCLLPGHPELEARLLRAWTETAPYTAAIPPDRHFLRATGWMLKAGLRPEPARNYGCPVSPPLDAAARAAMADTYWMFFSGLEPRIGSRDWNETLRLVRPESADFLPNRADFCATITYVVFKGVHRVPSRSGSGE